MTYYIIAGEASGDLHGSNLIKEIRKKDSGAKIVCWGGDLMLAAGAELRMHYRELAFMGFLEVIKNLPAILRNLSFCKEDISRVNPDVIVFIDYPGFNLRIADWAKKKGFKTAYYISPQVWAWKENRVKAIRRNIDKMLVILPFEKLFYEKWKYEAVYVGHPLVKLINEFRESGKGNSLRTQLGSGKKIIALLPGSRKQEILKKLPEMLNVSRYFGDCLFVVAKAPGLEESFYDEMLRNYPEVKSVSGSTYSLLSIAHAALVTSGTATLETALFRVPQVICYKGNRLSYLIARKLVKVRFIGLVNIIMDREVVKELIQDELNERNLISELKLISEDTRNRILIMSEYDKLIHLLGEGGDASEKAAGLIYELASLPE